MTSDPILFLDIDGVLNGHNFDREAESCTISARCVQSLNRVLDRTGAALVISSAWRYMVHGNAMTLTGFEYLLRTHGIRCPKRVLGITRKSEATGEDLERGEEIREWLAVHAPLARYAVVDDGDAKGFVGHPFVRTDGTTGLTDRDADRLIDLLKRPAAPPGPSREGEAAP